MYTFDKTPSGQTEAKFQFIDDYDNTFTLTTNYPTLELTKYAHLYEDLHSPFFMCSENSDESVLFEWKLKNIRELHEFLGKLIMQYELCTPKSHRETPIDEQIEIVHSPNK